MAFNTVDKGKTGEEKAVCLLENSGFVIIARNFRTKQGEIDIIALDGETLVFVEVKAWDSFSFEDLEYAVDKTKQKKIVETAKSFLQNHREYSNNRSRFDIVFIGPGFSRHLASAFMESL